MKYKSSSALTEKYRAQRIRFALVVSAIVLVLLLVAFLVVRGLMGKGVGAPIEHEGPTGEKIEYSGTLHNRLKRSEIPNPDFDAVPCYRMFADSNDVQLESAMAKGLKHPERVTDLDACKELVRMRPTKYYALDTMTHSKPYLVPDAMLMLWYIGERFQEVLKDLHHDDYGYLIVVTSALRSNEDVERLRRRNRNASENSCHRYGTTIDITYSKFLRSDGELVNEEWLKMALAKAMYELRYEGICHVKYEYRQPCFHITLNTVDYTGSKASERKNYPDFRYQAAGAKVGKKPKIFGKMNGE